MKLFLSLAEVQTLVRNAYALPIDAEIVISKRARKVTPESFTNFVAQHGQTMETEKIAAIKALRVIVPGLGLYGAKCAVENFDLVSNFVKANKAWPNVHKMDGTFIYSKS
jgi:ribosomal protein L7/L12